MLRARDSRRRLFLLLLVGAAAAIATAATPRTLSRNQRLTQRRILLAPRHVGWCLVHVVADIVR
jgi:hypothetical protein